MPCIQPPPASGTQSSSPSSASQPRPVSTTRPAASSRSTPPRTTAATRGNAERTLNPWPLVAVVFVGWTLTMVAAFVLETPFLWVAFAGTTLMLAFVLWVAAQP